MNLGNKFKFWSAIIMFLIAAGEFIDLITNQKQRLASADEEDYDRWVQNCRG